MSGSSRTMSLPRAREEAFLLFSDLQELVNKNHEFVTNCPPDIREKISDEDVKQAEQFRDQADNMRGVASRSHLKVVFFGRTSSGKSTLINALLGDNVLPCGIGHTTNCFVQVQGTFSDNPSILVPEEDRLVETQVSNLSELSSALSSHHLPDSSTITLNWPSSRCSLLEEDVVLVDSPGVDVTEGFDGWIDENCTDADVFVLVANSESTIMMREKAFFIQVATRISSPNVVIVENRWDCTEGEDEDMVRGARRQHLERCAQFLAREIHVATEDQVEELVFFISARESLRAAKKPRKGVGGFLERSLEFGKFVSLLKSSLSVSRIHTKFWSHVQTALSICIQLASFHEALAKDSGGVKNMCLASRHELMQSIKLTEYEMEQLTQTLRVQIGSMQDAIVRRITVVFHEEVNGLADLAQEFPVPFYDDPLVTRFYLAELEKFLETGLTRGIRARVMDQIAITVQQNEEEMVRRIADQLPIQTKNSFLDKFPVKNPFQVYLEIHSNANCEFNNNVRFRYSRGMFFWTKKYWEPGRKSTAEEIGKYSARPGSSEEIGKYSARPGSSTGIRKYTAGEEYWGITRADWILLSKIMMLAAASKQTTIGMILSGLACRGLGWKVLAAVGLGHAVLYLYEVVAWKGGNHETELKEKFVIHLQGKLRQRLNSVTGSCCQQIQQELHSTLTLVCELVEETLDRLQQDKQTIDTKLGDLTKVLEVMDELMDSSERVQRHLHQFQNSFLVNKT